MKNIFLHIVLVFSIYKLNAQTIQKTNKNIIGSEIQGSFSGKNKLETAKLIKSKEGFGNPIEDGIPDEYEIQFSNSNLKPIKIGCCSALLINEGDLNNDGKDEISIFQEPMNGCTFSMSTYSYIENNWKQIIKPFLIPTGCDEIFYDDLQNRIFKKKNEIYYYTTDLNNNKLIKNKVKP